MRAQPMFVHRQVVDAFGRVHLLLGGHGHALLIDGQRHHCSAVSSGHLTDAVQILAAVFQIDGINDAPSRIQFQAGFNAIRRSGVDHQRDAH